VSLLGADFTDLQLALMRNLLPAVLKGVQSPNLDSVRQILINGYPPESVPLLPPHLQQFFNDRHNGFYSDTYSSTRKQIVWRIDYLLANDVIRTMFAATKTKFDIGREMDAGKVILINNSKRLLGNTGCEFFGRFFIALILAAAHGRSGRSQAQKLPCFFYLDECHDVISEDENTAEIIDQCRSQKIATIYAHQRTDQIKSANVLSALSNCAIRYANSDDEAKFLAEKLRATPEYLRALPRGAFAAYIRDVTILTALRSRPSLNTKPCVALCANSFHRRLLPLNRLHRR
jgi:hypothetical protein